MVSVPVKALMERSQSLQNVISNSRSRDLANYQELQHQHEQLLAFNHALVEENNQCLADHAQLISQVGTKAVWIATASCSRMHSFSIMTHAFRHLTSVSMDSSQHQLQFECDAVMMQGCHPFVVHLSSLQTLQA